MQTITVIRQVGGLPPVFDVPSGVDALIVHHKGQDYCLTEGTDHGSYIRWKSEPVDQDYCSHIQRVTV